MKARNMRWGYDGGGIACGPVDGNTIVELMVMDEKGHHFFIADSKMMEFENIYISEVPLFDLLMKLFYGCDFEYENEKVNKLSVEAYDFESFDPPEEMERSRFANAIHLVRLAMEEYYGGNDEGEDYTSADLFMEEYVDQELDEDSLTETESTEDHEDMKKEDKKMTRYKVVEARCGLGNGGMACGPVSGPVIGEIHLQGDNGDDFYLCNAEVDSIPCMFKTPMSTIDDQINESIFDEGPRQEFFNSCYMDVGDYDEILQDKENELYDAFRYLIYIVRTSWKDMDSFIAKTVGKYLDEMEIPMSDIEESMMDEYEEEEAED